MEVSSTPNLFSLARTLPDIVPLHHFLPNSHNSTLLHTIMTYLGYKEDGSEGDFTLSSEVSFGQRFCGIFGEHLIESSILLVIYLLRTAGWKSQEELCTTPCRTSGTQIRQNSRHQTFPLYWLLHAGDLDVKRELSLSKLKIKTVDRGKKVQVSYGLEHFPLPLEEWEAVFSGIHWQTENLEYFLIHCPVNVQHCHD